MTIEQPPQQYYDELTNLWEASVRSTHHFLTEEDIQFYKPLVRTQYLPMVELYIIRNAQSKIVAFMGLSPELIEMLFIHPLEQGKGYGRQLLEYAINQKQLRHVDVNEQNEEALNFYLHLGFRIISRDATDSLGKPFPILHLRLPQNTESSNMRPNIHILPIIENKKQFLDLLLLADEQESMIDRYLERGYMFVLYNKDIPISACVVTNEGNGVYEIKNIATYPSYQRRGYGRILINFLINRYRSHCHTLLVGTGDCQPTISFYKQCGFIYSHRIPNFFTDNYDHPIIEEGKQLVDMIYLKLEP